VNAKLAGNPRLSAARAMQLVARDLGDSVETIRKAWRRRDAAPQ
jgi:hypothetical protein